MPKGEYSATTNYDKYDIVTYNGSNYVALVNVAGVLPTDDATKWKLFIDNSAATAAAAAATTAAENASAAVSYIAPTYTQTTYAVGDYVINDGKLYRCNTAITTAEAWTAAHWTETEIGDDVADLKSAIEQSATVHPIILQGEDEYIAIGSAGSTIGNPTVRTGYQYAIIPCNPGDEFLMESLAVESGIRVWCFADANKAVIKNTNGNIGAHQYITAPDNSAYFIANNKTGDGTVYKGYLAPADNQSKNPGSPIPMRRMGPNGDLYFAVSGTKISFSSTYSASSPRYISLVPCTPFDVFTINAHGGSQDRAYAFAQKDGTILTTAEASADLKNYQVTAPANAAYLLIQDHDGQTSYFGPTTALPALKSDIDTIDTEIEGLSGRVDSCNEDIDEINGALYNDPITGWVTGN